MIHANQEGQTVWNKRRTACANMRGVIDAGLHVYVDEYIPETELIFADNDQRGL